MKYFLLAGLLLIVTLWLTSRISFQLGCDTGVTKFQFFWQYAPKIINPNRNSEPTNISSEPTALGCAPNFIAVPIEAVALIIILVVSGFRGIHKVNNFVRKA